MSAERGLLQFCTCTHHPNRRERLVRGPSRGRQREDGSSMTTVSAACLAWPLCEAGETVRRRTFVTPPSAYLRQPLVRQISVAHSCAAGTGRSRPPGPREPRARYEPPGVMCGVPAAARWPLQNGQARVPVRAAVVPVQLPSGSACGELPASVNGPQTASRAGGQARCPVRFPESAASIASPAPCLRCEPMTRAARQSSML